MIIISLGIYIYTHTFGIPNLNSNNKSTDLIHHSPFSSLCLLLLVFVWGRPNRVEIIKVSQCAESLSLSLSLQNEAAVSDACYWELVTMSFNITHINLIHRTKLTCICIYSDDHWTFLFSFFPAGSFMYI